MTALGSNRPFARRHLLGIAGMSVDEVGFLLDLADSYVDLNRRADKKQTLLQGQTLINLFFESSTRTRTSFELAAKRLGADVIGMQVQASSIKKGETLIDTAMTLNAMRPDMLVVRHHDSPWPKEHCLTVHDNTIAPFCPRDRSKFLTHTC
jgi:aspartate carbamoyltransferase catalytic subunit